MRRRPVEPPAEPSHRPEGGRRLFYRRLRVCGKCGGPTSWMLEDVGPLCAERLAELGVEVPDEIPRARAVWVDPR